MTLDLLQLDLSASLKRGDTVRVSTLRFLISAIRNSAIAKYGAASDTSLTESDIFDVVKKQAKTHKESIEAYQEAQRDELVEKETQELKILEEFLPEELSDEELKKILEPVKSLGETNFGLIMKKAMEIVQGRADGGRVASFLKQMLQK